MRTKHPIIVITGATSGLGQLSAMELAKRGAHLILTARSKERAEATRYKIQEIMPSAKIEFFYGDLSLLSDVKRVGLEIAAAYPRIDVLLNNAGLHAFEQRVTSEGYAEMIAVNYLAPWLLTHTLQSSLIQSGHARVVNVASEASRNHGTLVLPDDLTDITPFTARGSSPIYGKTKLLNIMFTGELARQWRGTGIRVNALNPGFNVTGLGRELWFASVLERMLTFCILATHAGVRISLLVWLWIRSMARFREVISMWELEHLLYLYILAEMRPCKTDCGSLQNN